VVFEKLKAKKLTPFFEKEYVTVPNSIEDKYYPGFIKNTIRDFETKATGFEIQEGDTKKQAVFTLEKNLKFEPCLVLQFKYGDETFLPNSKRTTAVNLKNKQGTYIFKKLKRDFDWEKEMLKKAGETGLKEINGYFTPPGIDLLEKDNALHFLINWLNKNKPELIEKGFSVLQENQEKIYFTGEQRLEMKTKKSGDWFDVYATVFFGEFQIPFIKLKKYILNDIRELELPNGEIAVLPEEWFARYKGMLPFGKKNGEMLQYEKHHYPILAEALQQSDKSLIKKLQKLGKQENVDLPTTIQANLRSYQTEGFKWMFNLYKNDFGGCLADDMGLGKTLQTLALLLKLKRQKTEILVADPNPTKNQPTLFDNENEDEDVQMASLIVLPTSLVHNWEAEIRKFTPALKVYKHVGAQRKNAVEIS